jgi:energy-coupling factor transporter ATP-binding protein EcfA2
VLFSGKNFQPWSDFSLKISGFTVIAGSSNTGKSSIYRALRGILRNELPEEFIRNSQDEPLELTLEVTLCPSCKECTDNDVCPSCSSSTIKHIIKVVRPIGGSTKYVVDGKPYAKLQLAVPEPLLNLGFSEITVGEVSADPIFGRQNSAQFLLDPDTFKPSMINAILGAFGGTEKLEAGKKEAALRNTRINSEAKLLAEEIRSSEGLINTLEPLVERGNKLSQQLSIQEKSVLKLETELSIVSSAVHHRQKLEPLVELSKALVIPNMAEVETLSKIKISIQGLISYRARLWSQISGLSALEKLTLEWGKIVTLWKQIKAISDLVELQRGSKSAQTTWMATIPGIGETLKLVEQRQISVKELKAATLLLAKITDLKKQLIDVDSKLVSIKEETEKTVCDKCGQVWEHVCGQPNKTSGSTGKV